MTKQRKLILEIVSASHGHPTAQEIFAAARERLPSISLGTVYRNLGVLVEDGVLLRLSHGTMPDRYDLPREPHWHLICDTCGSVRDIPADAGLLSALEARSGERLTSALLTAHCICRRCLAQKEKE